MSIYEHNFDVDPNNPANREQLEIVSCACRSCNEIIDACDELKFCPSCGDIIIYIEDDGRYFYFDGEYYKEVE